MQAVKKTSQTLREGLKEIRMDIHKMDSLGSEDNVHYANVTPPGENEMLGKVLTEVCLEFTSIIIVNEFSLINYATNNRATTLSIPLLSWRHSTTLIIKRKHPQEMHRQRAMQFLIMWRRRRSPAAPIMYISIHLMQQWQRYLISSLEFKCQHCLNPFITSMTGVHSSAFA